jgi:MSHA biogenesis protein MshN
VNDANGDLKVILSLNPGVELARLAMNKNEKFPELQMDLIYKNAPLPNIAEPQAEPEKKLVIDLANNDLYQQAAALVKEGRKLEAIRSLRQVLTVSPNFTSARELLGMLLIEQAKWKEARDVIEQGLQQKPSYLPYVQMKAHVLVSEGKVAEALNLLRSFTPALTVYPDYYAFIAALYQRLGQFAFSEKMYEELVKVEPNNGLYWAGLGISLNKLGQHAEAIDAFAKAEQLGNLNPELKHYVESH